MTYRATPEYNLVKLYPEIAASWSSINLKPPSEYAPQSSFKAWWHCLRGHRWQVPIRIRVRSRGCPYCTGWRPTSEYNLASLYPDLVKEWSPRNKKLPSAMMPHTNTKAWWVCAQGHEWMTAIGHRVRGRGCPSCAGRLPTPERNFGLLYPYLASQWSPRNRRTPVDYTPHSRSVVFWLCQQGHEWSAPIYSRVKGNGCRRCSGKIPTLEYNLAAIYPALVAEWSPSNTKPPTAYAPSSNVKVGWVCAIGHSWQTTISARTRRGGTGCPGCSFDQTHSAPERFLVAALAIWLGQAVSPLGYFIPDICWPNGRPVSPDFVVDDDAIKLALEYDGAQFHSKNRSKQRDRLKDKLLHDAGFLVIRIRESPLRTIRPNCDLVLDPSVIYTERELGFPSLIQASQAHIDLVCRRQFGQETWAQFKTKRKPHESPPTSL
jgi:hypothetical protein